MLKKVKVWLGLGFGCCVGGFGGVVEGVCVVGCVFRVGVEGCRVGVRVFWGRGGGIWVGFGWRVVLF